MSQKFYLEQTLETLVDLVDLQRKSSERNFDAVNKTLSELAVNVGQLAVQQKQTATNIDRLGDRIDRLTAAIERQNQTIDGHLALSITERKYCRINETRNQAYRAGSVRT